MISVNMRRKRDIEHRRSASRITAQSHVFSEINYGPWMPKARDWCFRRATGEFYEGTIVSTHFCVEIKLPPGPFALLGLFAGVWRSRSGPRTCSNLSVWDLRKTSEHLMRFRRESAHERSARAGKTNRKVIWNKDQSRRAFFRLRQPVAWTVAAASYTVIKLHAARSLMLAPEIDRENGSCDLARWAAKASWSLFRLLDQHDMKESCRSALGETTSKPPRTPVWIERQTSWPKSRTAEGWSLFAPRSRSFSRARCLAGSVPGFRRVRSEFRE